MTDAAKELLRCAGHSTSIVTRPEMPRGPLNRVADNSRAKRMLGWQPEVGLKEDLHRGVDWYFSVKDRAQVRSVLGWMLTER